MLEQIADVDAKLAKWKDKLVVSAKHPEYGVWVVNESGSDGNIRLRCKLCHAGK